MLRIFTLYSFLPDMPARTVLFDLKANPVHSFEPKPRNFIAYQPQGRLFLNAGFGNLTGTIDIWDLKSRKKVSEFQAPNSTTCEWSPDGRYILTGTLSPRLRVDNGVKVWWCTGKLLHVQMIEELYQVSSIRHETMIATIWKLKPDTDLADIVATRSCRLVPGFPARDALGTCPSHERCPVHAGQQDDGRDQQTGRCLPTTRCEGDRYSLDLQAGGRGWSGCNAVRQRVWRRLRPWNEDASLEEHPWSSTRCRQAQR